MSCLVCHGAMYGELRLQGGGFAAQMNMTISLLKSCEGQYDSKICQVLFPCSGRQWDVRVASTGLFGGGGGVWLLGIRDF